MDITTIGTPIGLHNLPASLLFEQDGSCWRATADLRENSGWRWKPMNWKAIAKDGPTGEMTEYPVFAMGFK